MVWLPDDVVVAGSDDCEVDGAGQSLCERIEKLARVS